MNPTMNELPFKQILDAPLFNFIKKKFRNLNYK